jgi:hypothetical protein
MPRVRARLVLVSLLLLAPVVAQSRHVVVEIGDLEIVDGSIPADWDWSWALRTTALLPRVRIDGDGEAWLGLRDATRWNWQFEEGLRASPLAIRIPAARDVTGTLYVPATDWSRLQPVRFRIRADQFAAERPREFLEVQRQWYLRLLQEQFPGAAWFRHRIAEIDRELGVERPLLEGTWSRQLRHDDAGALFDLFSGGRAVAENLQLDRALPPRDPAGDSIDVTTLDGIRIREFDWAALLGAAEPRLDALAAAIPHDQHAVFLPDLSAAVRVVEEVDRHGSALLLALDQPRGEEHSLLLRYERQLGFDLRTLARELPRELVAGVALTGSDFEFRSGTDVALLFATKQPEELAAALRRAIETGAGETWRAAKPIERGAIAGRQTDDRSLSSFVARIGDVVAVANSVPQLERLAAVQAGRVPALGSLAEYRFFRQRYPAGTGGEAAFVVLSDATIRRWCGPRWRIASARRVRAAALLAELTAMHAGAIARRGGGARDLPALPEFTPLGALRLEPDGVRSARFGSLAFLTPIAEMPLERVAPAEAEGYRVWREGFERNWAGAFDPIALSIGFDGERIVTDLTVMPLILGTEYRWLRELTRGAKLSARAIDVADSLMHVAFALNPKSGPARLGVGFTGGLARELGADPLGWIGSTVAIAAEQDPFWGELAQAPDRGEFFDQNWHRLPVALVAEVENALQVTAFLASLRAYVQDTAPGMTTWRSVEHAGRAYVRVEPAPDTLRWLPGEERQIVICYAVDGRRLLVSLNEALVQRAVARAADAGKRPEAPAPPGEHAWLRAGADSLDVLRAIAGGALQENLQGICWRNLPILEEWRREFPEQDPVLVHERLFGVRLVCPGGGQYLPDPKDGTLASSVYGHPAAPRDGPRWPAALRDLAGGEFGLTFEADGLRARATVQRR